jgi:hypothetical protein
MATFDLQIRCGNIDEFKGIAALLCGASLGEYEDDTTGAANGDGGAVETVVAEPKPKRTRGKKAGQQDIPAPTQEPTTGQPIEPTPEPKPQPTPGGTEAPPAESIPPNQEAGADVFETARPQAVAGEDQEITMQQLKDAMAGLLKVKSAAVAMKTLEDATGCKSLSSGSPSVAEKAKTDPAIMKLTLDALNTAAAS